ncbi:helix-turn-helix domain-containing protein [Gluconobacter cerinus]|uniref:Transcriptional regulator n=1 Tax=Gluconobacter cerinus TaxID=38307 RepID=A0A1B6VP76_9PROT|nr:helix-turn-helix transcriptional regulator [Gluconobacter cerinus]OAJ69022.1 transcriptional regulator [Gluconobacter cerinus]
MTQESLASRLKEIRELRGLSQSKLARLVGITPQAIQALESGSSAGSKHLASIAGALGVEALWLANGEGDKERKPRRDLSDPSDAQPAGNLYFLTDDREIDSGWSFPPTRIYPKDSTVPVFLCDNVENARMPKQAKIEIQHRIHSWILSFNEDIPRDRISKVIKDYFMYVEDDLPEEQVPRPHYLVGQKEAYAVYINSHKTMCSSSINKTIAFVSPHRELKTGNICIIWHKTNTFIVGEVYKIEKNSIKLENKDLIRDMMDEPDFEKSLDMKTYVEFPFSEIKSIHSVLGLEFSTPNSSRIQIKSIMRSH